MTQLKIAIRVLLIGTCLAVMAAAQTSSNSPLICENDLLAEKQIAVQIIFDHVETLAVVNGKPTNRFWFKLRNNTKCQIEVLSAESVGTLLNTPRPARDQNDELVKNDKGGLKIERSSALQNNDIVPVIYHLFNSKQKAAGAGNYEGCVLLTPEVPSGVTVMFRVDSPKLKKGYSLAVFYAYKGEKDPYHQGVLSHKTVFNSEKLPPSIFTSQMTRK